MKKINLNDNTTVYCLKQNEATVLDEHISGYLKYGIELNEGDVIIDVGANIGILGIRLSKIYNDITIHAFEPIPEIYKVLKKNSEISLNPKFKTYMMGISNIEKLIKFTYFPNSPALSTSKPDTWKQNKKDFIAAVKGSVVNASKKIWWAKLIPNFIIPLIAKYLKSNSYTIKSPVIILSNFIKKHKIKKINLLKIDCEGEEINVLKGISSVNWKIINNVVMEVNDINNNLEIAKSILVENKLNITHIEKEKGFEETKLTNIYASKKTIN
tara:strand:+ start:24 stop:833 length:810 start_codon:yes stop_codon:yes gene_type:complete